MLDSLFTMDYKKSTDFIFRSVSYLQSSYLKTILMNTEFYYLMGHLSS